MTSNHDRKLNLLTIHKLETFIDTWRLTQQYSSPSTHPLEIATALENVAQKIRKEQADKAREDYWEGYMDGH
jgi:hypothetical protein